MLVSDLPNLEKFCQNLLSLDVDGLTVHPRPDARHITLSDVEMLKSITESRSASLILKVIPRMHSLILFMPYSLINALLFRINLVS